MSMQNGSQPRSGPTQGIKKSALFKATERFRNLHLKRRKRRKPYIFLGA